MWVSWTVLIHRSKNLSITKESTNTRANGGRGVLKRDPNRSEVNPSFIFQKHSFAVLNMAFQGRQKLQWKSRLMGMTAFSANSAKESSKNEMDPCHKERKKKKSDGEVVHRLLFLPQMWSGGSQKCVRVSETESRWKAKRLQGKNGHWSALSLFLCCCCCFKVWFQNRRSKERRMKQLSALGARRHAFFRGPRRMRPLGGRLEDPDILGPGPYGYYGGRKGKTLFLIFTHFLSGLKQTRSISRLNIWIKNLTLSVWVERQEDMI